MEKKEREIPVKEGDVIEVEIVGTGKDGDGIAKFEGFVIIIPNAKEGERHEVQVTTVKPRMAFAEIVNNPEE